MRKLTILLALLISSPALSFEFRRGGFESNTNVADLFAREAAGRVVIDGWYKSRDTVYLASPRACIVAGSDTQALFHGGTDRVRARQGNIPSIWNGLIAGDTDPWYRDMMNRSPWGRRIYAFVVRQGYLDTPDFTTLRTADLIALGMPVCR